MGFVCITNAMGAGRRTAAAQRCGVRRPRPPRASPQSPQASSRKVIGKEEWERKLAEVDLRKEDLNSLVMNFLVTEVLCRPTLARGRTVASPAFLPLHTSHLLSLWSGMPLVEPWRCQRLRECGLGGCCNVRRSAWAPGAP